MWVIHFCFYFYFAFMQFVFHFVLIWAVLQIKLSNRLIISLFWFLGHTGILLSDIFHGMFAKFQMHGYSERLYVPSLFLFPDSSSSIFNFLIHNSSFEIKCSYVQFKFEWTWPIFNSFTRLMHNSISLIIWTSSSHTHIYTLHKKGK